MFYTKSMPDILVVCKNTFISEKFRLSTGQTWVKTQILVGLGTRPLLVGGYCHGGTWLSTDLGGASGGESASTVSSCASRYDCRSQSLAILRPIDDKLMINKEVFDGDS